MSLEAEVQPVALAALLDRLGPVRGSLRLPGEADGNRVVACSEALTSDFVRAHVQDYARALGTDDLPAAASVWCKYYDAAMQTAALAAMTALGVGLNLAPSQTALVMHDGLPQAVYLPAPEALILEERCPVRFEPGLDRTADLAAFQGFVWRGLLGEHLAVLVTIAAETTGIRPRVLWSNIASRAEHVFAHLADDPRTAAASAEDRAALLGTATCPWTTGRNPMCEPTRWIALDGDLPATPVRVRKTCCLKHRLPEKRYCGSCPLLSACDRRARLRGEAEA